MSQCIKLRVASFLAMLVCTSNAAQIEFSPIQAPDYFQALLETTKGDVVIEAHRSWAPHSVDRFYNLVKSGYLDGVIVINPGPLVSFGLQGNRETNTEWLEHPVGFDPPLRVLRPGDVIYTNLVNNRIFIVPTGADGFWGSSQGTPVLGRLIKGSEVVDSIDDSHNTTKIMKQLLKKGDAAVRKKFPNVDWIVSASILPRSPPVLPTEIKLADMSQFPIEPDQALLRVYRPQIEKRNNPKYKIHLDGELIATLKPNQYFEILLSPAGHHVSTKASFNPMSLLTSGLGGVLAYEISAEKNSHIGEFEAGKVYHIRLSTAGNTGLLFQVANDFGSEDSKGLDRVEIMK